MRWGNVTTTKALSAFARYVLLAARIPYTPRPTRQGRQRRVCQEEPGCPDSEWWARKRTYQREYMRARRAVGKERVV